MELHLGCCIHSIVIHSSVTIAYLCYNNDMQNSLKKKKIIACSVFLYDSLFIISQIVKQACIYIFLHKVRFSTPDQ